MTPLTAPPPPPTSGDVVVTAGGVEHPQPVNDTGTVRLVVGALALIALAALFALCLLVLSGVTLPEGLVVGLLALPTACGGALGAMLASTASRRQ